MARQHEITGDELVAGLFFGSIFFMVQVAFLIAYNWFVLFKTVTAESALFLAGVATAYGIMSTFILGYLYDNKVGQVGTMLGFWLLFGLAMVYVFQFFDLIYFLLGLAAVFLSSSLMARLSGK